MALVLADRVLETCTSPGTGAVTLLGATTGYQTFSAGIGNGNTCYYCIADQGGANWEVGIGTYSSSGNTLTRTTPISGSAATPVNFSSGTQNVFVTYPAEKSVNLDSSGKLRANSNNYLDFASASPSKIAGRMWYNDTDGTWNLVMGGGNITQQVGEELFIYGKASNAISGDSLLQLIFKTGTVGGSGVLQFAPTTSGITDPNLILGLGTEDISAGNFGRITTYGTIHGVNTSGSTYSETWVSGDVLWYDPATGGLTKTQPSAPNMKYQVGTVLTADATAGSFFVDLQSGSTLGGTDSNVQFGTLATNDLIQYNGTYWTNVTIGSGSGIQPYSAYTAFTNVTNTFSTNQIIEANTSTDALRITQTGTGNALLVEDSANPDSTPTVIKSDGKVGIGTDTPVVPLQLAYTTGTPDASLISTDAVVVTAEETAPGFVFVVAGSSSGNRGVFKATRCRGTLAAPLVPNNNDNVFSLLGAIYDGATTRPTAGISFDVDGTVSSGVAPQRITFSTGTASSRVEAMRINSAGEVGIGAASGTAINLLVAKNITGATTAVNVLAQATVQSDVTSSAYMFRSRPSTAAASFTVSNLYHYAALQSTIGAGSAVTTQYGFVADSTLTGATNNYGFYSNIASGTGRWNFYAAGSADNYFAGSVGIGTTSLTARKVGIGGAITGATSAYSITSQPTVASDVTTLAANFYSALFTSASAFSLTSYRHFTAVQGTIGAGSTVTNQYGFHVDATLTGATNNYGFYSNIASGTGRYNFYAAGTADNYFGGIVGVRTGSTSGVSLRSSPGNFGLAAVTGIQVYGNADSTATTAIGFDSYIGQDTGGALTTLTHFSAGQRTVSGTITNQIGFIAGASLTGATNNYGFYGNIAAGTGRYNFYAAGTADNYFAGNVGIGKTAPTFPLHTYLNSNVQAAFENTGSTTSFIILRNTTSTGNNIRIGSDTNDLTLFTNGTERIRIKSDGTVGIGNSGTAAENLRIGKNITGGTSAFGVNVQADIQSDVTSGAYLYYTYPTTQATTFTLGGLRHFSADQGTFGAGSNVTTQYGFEARSSLTGATNNYGFYGNIAAGTGRYNFYAAGTAANYFGGVTTIGKALQETQTAISASDIDLSTGNYFTKTIAAITTFTVSNVPTTGTAASFILDLTNGGAFAVTWWTGVKWAGGTAPTLTAAGRDVLGFFTYDGGTTWSGFVLGKDVK